MNRRSFALLFLALALPLAAQDAQPARLLKMRCLTFQVDGAVPELYAHSVLAREEPIGIPVRTRSYLNHETETLTMEGENIVFTTDSDRASIKDPGKVLAQVRVPATVRSVILMFLPGGTQDGGPKFRILPIDDSTGAFPRGSLKVINLSPVPIRLMLEDQRFDIRNGASQVIDDPPVNDRNASAMRAFIQEEGQWKRVGAGIWPHPGKKRVLQVAFLNPVSKQIEVRGIRDIAVRD